MNRSRSWVTEYVALLSGTFLSTPSSPRGLMSGGLTGYAQAGGSSAASAGPAKGKLPATTSARTRMGLPMACSLSVRLAGLACRVLLVEQRELSVQLRPVACEHRRLGEEGLAHHREELGRVLGRVRVDEGRLAGVDLGAEALVGFFERLAPLRRVHALARVGVGLVAAAVHVDLVRELVDHDVVASLGHADVLPREDHRASRPRLAGELFLEGMDDAVLVDFLLLHAEFSGVDDDPDPALVDVEAQVEDGQAGLR